MVPTDTLGWHAGLTGRDVDNQKEPGRGHSLPLVLLSAPGATEASILACSEQSGSFAEDGLIAHYHNSCAPNWRHQGRLTDRFKPWRTCGQSDKGSGDGREGSGTRQYYLL